MKLSGLTKMVKRQLVCNVFHNDESDDFYIGTASAIYCSGEILIPLVTEDRHMVGIICQSHLAPLEDEIKNNGFIRYYQRKQTDGTVYYVVKNGMRVRAAVMAYTVPDYAEAKLQELVAMLAETHIGEQEEPEQTFDDLNAEKDSEQQE